MKTISEMNRYELDGLEEQIAHRRLELSADEIKHAGLDAALVDTIEYVLVYSPVDGLENAWATPEECRRLLDTLANLPPAEAYRRWFLKVVDKFHRKPYTQDDAARDTRDARKRLEQQYAAGEIDGKQFSELYKTTSFMDLAEE